jgi:hypothetical protein
MCSNVRGWAAAAVLLMLAWVPQMKAGGPRFVTGSSSWRGSGFAIAFYTSSPAYYTDPGNLSATVTHAQADAMVAAAAATWNVSTSTLVLKQGGELAEHVSSANVYFNGSEMVFPADVSATNYQSIPIAVIYDTDGSVIDTLLGDGASDPSGCRDTGVVESVDSIGQEGAIHHAMLILNGRCVGSTPQQLLQMQYQLQRAFGRVVGISWSQVNDNIFTGATPPTAGEINYWPIMHPIDVLCGPYSYQCMTNPFQLRMDDLSSLSLLYPVMSANAALGQVLTSANALTLYGNVSFATGQGMQWVNLAATRQLGSTAKTEPWQVAACTTGYTNEENGGNPVSGPEGVPDDIGGTWGPSEGLAQLRVADTSVENAFMTTEAIDPLYTGEYAIAPYERPPVTPSGSPLTLTDWSGPAGTNGYYMGTPSGAASSCAPGADGTQGAPASSGASGWWNGQLCPAGHSSWWSVQINAGSSWALEVTALDESGSPTTSKAQPVIGVWNVGDKGLPTVASMPVSMNAMAPGVTQLQMPAGSSAGSYMFAVADQFGAGRPDFGYKARVLYAAGVRPTTVNLAGGQITIAGEGFRTGNQVSVNGVTATVVSVSSNQIVATVPSMATAGASMSTPVDVMVTDIATGGQTDIANGFMYSNVLPDEMFVVLQPATLETGVTAALPFAVQLVMPDGVTPIANASVQFAVVSGSAGFGACSGAATCTLQTDAMGTVLTTVTGGAAGPVVLSASEVSGSGAVQIMVMDANPVRAVSIGNAASYLAAGASATWTISLSATQDAVAAAGVPVVWTAGSGVTLSSGTTTADGTGSAAVTVSATRMGAGTATVTGCVWSTVCASWTVTAVDSSQWRVEAGTGASQSVSAGTTLAAVTLNVTDTAGHALQGAAVSLYQTADGWEGTCVVPGRCAASPVLASAQSSAISDANGSVTVTPLEVPGLPQVVNIAAVTGTQGFVAVSLPVTP